ncbi:glycosyltransferase family 1 protein [Hypoxylon sp. FL0890]|nr:glycosyltransferase family 1 protein [Hypoxylon sp. FL0890]
MATESQQISEGQRLPQDDQNMALTESSSSPSQPHPPSSNTAPPRIPTFEELLSAIIEVVEDSSSTATTVSPLNQEHQLCLVEMEARRGQAVRNATTIWSPAEFISFLWQQFKLALCTHMIRCWIPIYTGLYLICWYYPFIAYIVFICIRHYIVVFDRWGSSKVDWVRLKSSSDNPHYLLVVCGSGGHTGEMIRMMDRSIGPREGIYHRRYAVAYGDQMSYDKVMSFERTLQRRFENENVFAGSFDIEYFHRGRHVHQSWVTTPFTALACLADIFRILTTAPGRHTVTDYRFPGVIVTDGPGSGFLFLLAAHWLKMWFMVPDDFMQSIFIESWARVNSMSLTGKLIDRFCLADVFIAQYKTMSSRGPYSYVDNMVAMPTHPNMAV